MRLMALQKRAVSEGVPSDAVAESMLDDDAAASLIDLIVDVVSRRGPTDRLLSTLVGGGTEAADALLPALDHAMDVLEHLSR